MPVRPHAHDWGRDLQAEGLRHEVEAEVCSAEPRLGSRGGCVPFVRGLSPDRGETFLPGCIGELHRPRFVGVGVPLVHQGFVPIQFFLEEALSAARSRSFH